MSKKASKASVRHKSTEHRSRIDKFLAGSRSLDSDNFSMGVEKGGVKKETDDSENEANHAYIQREEFKRRTGSLDRKLTSKKSTLKRQGREYQLFEVYQSAPTYQGRETNYLNVKSNNNNDNDPDYVNVHDIKNKTASLDRRRYRQRNQFEKYDDADSSIYQQVGTDDINRTLKQKISIDDNNNEISTEHPYENVGTPRQKTPDSPYRNIRNLKPSMDKSKLDYTNVIFPSSFSASSSSSNIGSCKQKSPGSPYLNVRHLKPTIVDSKLDYTNVIFPNSSPSTVPISCCSQETPSVHYARIDIGATNAINRTLDTHCREQYPKSPKFESRLKLNSK